MSPFFFCDAPQMEYLAKLKDYTGKLIITTPMYEHKAYAAYVKSLVDTAIVLTKTNIQFEYWPGAGDFHVERAVNNVLNRFLHSDATDILMIDSDEGWNVEGVLRLLIHPEEVVSGVYRMKNNWMNWTAQVRQPPQGRELGDGTALLIADRLPGGFLRIKKTALEKIARVIPERYMDGEMSTVPFFLTKIKDGLFTSCDYVFSDYCKQAGVPLWVDPDITIGHFGVTEYQGNYDQYLKGLLKENEAFSEVQRMAQQIEARNG